MTELPLFAKRDQDAATRLRGDFCALLADGQWHRGKWLLRQLGTNERVIREMAERSQGRVISGQLGYRLIEAATNAEIDHAERWLLSQARRMTERAVAIRKARNRHGEAA